MSDFNNYANAAKSRAEMIRLRTWSLTIVMLIALMFYLVVNLTTNNSLNWIDFILVCSIQIISYCLYFPEGENFGYKNSIFISNKNAYNEKASDVNDKKLINQLREYCDYEYTERQKRYIQNECGKIGIEVNDLELLKEMTKKDVKKIDRFEVKRKENKVIILFSRKKRRILYNLLFKTLPIEKNNPETILSAVENDGIKAIHDGSVIYKNVSYIKKFLIVILVGLIFGYIGYTVKDGFGFAEIVKIVMYMTTMLTTSVMAFSSGETSIKVYKSHFYVELSNFIDSFNEWINKQKEVV